MATITLAGPTDFKVTQVNGKPCLEFETSEGDEVRVFFGNDEQMEDLRDAVSVREPCPDMLHEDGRRMAADRAAEQGEVRLQELQYPR